MVSAGSGADHEHEGPLGGSEGAYANLCVRTSLLPQPRATAEADHTASHPAPAAPPVPTPCLGNATALLALDAYLLMALHAVSPHGEITVHALAELTDTARAGPSWSSGPSAGRE